MEIIEPISRKLIHLAKIYLNVLSGRLAHLGINRYYYVMSLIHAENGKLTQKALGEKLGMDKSAIVGIIDYLTDKGYVYREVNPADRRQHLLRTTPKAVKAVPDIMAKFNEMNDTVATDISPKEMEIFYKVLHQMEENLKPYATKEMDLDLNFNK
ncbi:MarR family winged helix-turn-helix transcriptional regulator [Mucilaginibacter myungsuensis]|uniref:MarR family transcriptional regulator n=1 Tax=Mucilaginibacter myungsuensis TaxID=649104 RepID=A0A929L0T5_9SPHI|nr:MarR family transcriptional regulator [Mucilaginibacter myungsuensis]MBE9661186.1 MarR family transcriptional regulator [Mucilaginibacter myungsuensis]MDN3597331.1 MarR family transcriptional regulator [Mucilaginibacter myungsuensis]